MQGIREDGCMLTSKTRRVAGRVKGLIEKMRVWSSSVQVDKCPVAIDDFRPEGPSSRCKYGAGHPWIA